tara:strand:- start:770 stop:3589 length:2820 start_codon:yes stop_codon:yes gene_type:complete
MINKINKIISILIFFLFSLNAYSVESFNFDITELEILENGNKFIGNEKGIITSDNGVIINADKFEYDKILDILNASGNVKINDTKNNYIIYTKKVTYNKGEEIIFTENGSRGISLENDIEITANNFEYNKTLNKVLAKDDVVIHDKKKKYKVFSDFMEYFRNENKVFTKGNSKGLDLIDQTIIVADNFEYNILENIIVAEKNVIINNEIEDYTISADFIKYLKNKEEIFTNGKTSAIINSEYNFDSSDVIFLKNSMELISNKNSTITDKYNLYNLAKFKYLLNKEELRGEKIIISSNYKSPKSDKFYLSSGIINLKSQDFVAKDTKIKIHKDIFNKPENDPRLYGVSSSKKGQITTVNKGIFTSCKDNGDNCPPWSIKASQIKHNKSKKQLIYENAIVRIYNFPVFYFPKFFHPDPTVERQSGFLMPQINSSEELGDSIHIPYFHAISSNKDITIKPTFFNNNIKMFQNEYRQKNKNSYLTADFSLTTGYKSKSSDKKNSISHLFTKFESDLNLNNFNYSDLYISLQKVTNDTYLKVFDTNLIETDSNLKPKSQNQLTSEVKLSLGNNDYSFNTGIKAFEKLNKKNNDRFQYILPYYNFNKSFNLNFFDGEVNFSSSGSNNLNDTNNLKSKVINDLNFQSKELILGSGFVNSFNAYFKNSSTLGKNDDNYKSSPQIELMNIYELTSELPLKKTKGDFNNFLTPKISFRFNPSDMKNYSTSNKNMTVDNIFNINRLGIDDSYEKGRSLTVGLDYRKEKLDDINKYFEFKLATAFRDTEEDFIPSSTSLNKKNSNLFGSIENKFSDHLSIDYNFSIDNNFDRFEYNSVNANLSFKNFETSVNFVEENGATGDENFLENTTTYNLNDNNMFSFKTRRNRKLNLTEFYDLVYEYKNDCLIASVKYKKKYYSDRDLKPSENLLFTVTLFPFTTYEHNETNLFKD